MSPKIYLLLSFVLLSDLVAAQKMFLPDTAISTKATSIIEKIVIDGKLEEAAWQQADTISFFTQIEPYQGKASEYATIVKLLYDKRYIYVGVFCKEPDGKKGIRVNELSRDFSFRDNDTFAVGIDGFHDERNTITLAVNPFGAQKDYLSYDDTYFDFEWNGYWMVKTQITEGGWFAEFAIPWKTLRYKSNEADSEKQTWGINFVRQKRSANEISAWAPYPRAFGFNRAEYFGKLTGIRPPKPKLNIQFNPYTLISTQNDNEARQYVSSLKQGGDVKWVANPKLVVDATFNTDFAQADADLQVNNISRFSVFLPERRQFFLENASLFGSGLTNLDGKAGNMMIVPFFSRRIGLNTDGQLIPINAGSRMVGRSERNSWGIMGIHQGGRDDTQRSFNGTGRYVHNLGKQNRLGALFTLQSDESGTSMTTGFDGLIRLSSIQQLNFMALQSQQPNHQKTGYSGYLQYAVNSNQFSAWWTAALVDRHFNPSLGFVSRRNVLSSNFGLVANYRGDLLPFPKIFRAFQPRVLHNVYYQASSGKLMERELRISPFWLEFQNGASLSVEYQALFQNLESNFEPLGILIQQGQFNYSHLNINAKSDPSRKIAGEANYRFGSFYDGAIKELFLQFSINPIPHIGFSFFLDHKRFEQIGAERTTRAITLFNLESRLFMTPRLQLFGMYQKNTFNSSSGVNLRFAWEYKPLSYIYLVYNSRNIIDEPVTSISENQLIFKVNFLKQF